MNIKRHIRPISHPYCIGYCSEGTNRAPRCHAHRKHGSMPSMASRSSSVNRRGERIDFGSSSTVVGACSPGSNDTRCFCAWHPFSIGAIVSLPTMRTFVVVIAGTYESGFEITVVVDASRTQTCKRAQRSARFG